MDIKIVDSVTLKRFLETNKMTTEKIAAELNGNIIPKSEYEAVILKDDDVLEVVSFVGGG